MPFDTVLPTRGTRTSSTHQWAGTGPSLLDQLHPGGRHQKQENYNLEADRTESANAGQNLPRDKLVPGPWVMRGECTAGTQDIPYRGLLLHG